MSIVIGHGLPPPTGYAAKSVRPHMPALLCRLASGLIASRMKPFSPQLSPQLDGEGQFKPSKKEDISSRKGECAEP